MGDERRRGSLPPESSARFAHAGRLSARWRRLETTRARIASVTSGPAQDEVRRLLGLIEEVDPRIRSVSAVNSHALAEAETLDRETAAGHRRSPLHGRAVLVKDNIDTAGLASTAGSLALADAPPGARRPTGTPAA